MSSLPRETFRHLQKAWDLAHTASFVEDRMSHADAGALLKRMQKYLANHLSQYDDAEYAESAFAIRDNTISWEIRDLAAAAGLAPAIAPTRVQPPQAIAPSTDASVRPSKGKGKARARSPSPSPPAEAVDRRPSPRPLDLLQLIARAQANRLRNVSAPIAGPSGVRPLTPAPAFDSAPLDAAVKRKRGSTARPHTPRGANASSYDRKKSLALTALETNPGAPVLRAASPVEPPITVQELAGLGNHQSVPLMICAQCVLSATPSACTFRGPGERCGPCQRPKTKPCSFRTPPAAQVKLYNRYAQLGSLSIGALRSLCQDVQEARRLEAAAIDHASQLQLRTLQLEVRLSETIRAIASNSPTAEPALASFFDGEVALRRAAIGLSLFDFDSLDEGDHPLRNLSDLLRGIPSHNFERFPQLLQLLQGLGYLDDTGNFVRPAQHSSTDHPMLDIEAEEVSVGNESGTGSSESESSDEEGLSEEESSDEEGSPEEDRPVRTEDSSGSGSDEESSKESEDDRPPSKKVRLTQ
ncbi:hypothetical protein CVT25_001368 [Psilocybe cyanescens]|uniref:Uncharacterized protein n=1 Tax=Psilocybe cyanescens TaxID=93625 RepID=A0A409X5P7_PSICY|nr:hypothetical protein CVT25_001368 [Psilocybe cyanescens]